jgi:hypothetical protein
MNFGNITSSGMFGPTSSLTTTNSVSKTPNLQIDYSSWIAPSARYGHSAAYIEIEILESASNQIVKRKYMYIYGGFSYD